MPRPKRDIAAVAAATESPPPVLPAKHAIAVVRGAAGSNLFRVSFADGRDDALVELPARFRSTIWIRRGSYVVIAFDDGDSRAEIANIVRDERVWRKMPYWPSAFAVNKRGDDRDGDDDEGPNMPPSDSESETT